MRIAFGCDHAGIELKTTVVEYLQSRGVDVTDCGTWDSKSVDYPDFAASVCRSVLQGKADLGVLVCGTGIGMSISANKFSGIRAALVHNAYTARMARAHNNANIIAFGSRVIGAGLVPGIIDAFLDTPFEGDRHCLRLDKITALEG